MRSRPLIAIIAALAGALACGFEPPSRPTATPGAPEIGAPAAEPIARDTPAEARPAPADPPASAPEPAGRPTGRPAATLESLVAAPEPVPLERLLALPPYRKPDAPDLAELLRRDAAAAAADPTSARRSRLRFDLARRIDAPIERDLKREQVDAGVAVSVGEDTSVRTGVRVQRDTEAAAPPTLDTTPSIGIEKRF